MMRALVSLVAMAGGPIDPAPSAARESVAVMPLTGAGVDAATLRALDPLLVYAIADLGPYKVVSPAEIDAQIGRERMQEAAGCGPESVSCAAEIAGALGTRLLLHAQLTRVGGK